MRMAVLGSGKQQKDDEASFRSHKTSILMGSHRILPWGIPSNGRAIILGAPCLMGWPHPRCTWVCLREERTQTEKPLDRLRDDIQQIPSFLNTYCAVSPRAWCVGASSLSSQAGRELTRQRYSVSMWVVLQGLPKPRKEVRKLQLLCSGQTPWKKSTRKNHLQGLIL